jgi:probable addiction module antidote protein
MKQVKTASYEEHLHDDLKDPETAAAYLNECFLDDKRVFLMALSDVAKAHGVTKLAKESGLNRESLYKIFNGNPKLDTLDSLLKTMGLQISFTPAS